MATTKSIYPAETEILTLLLEEFTYSKQSLFEELCSIIPDFSLQEMDALIDDGLIDNTINDGSERFFSRSIASLVESLPEIRSRVTKLNKFNILINEDLAHHISICADRIAYLSSMAIEVELDCSIKPLFASSNQPHLIYLPFPIESQHQTHIQLVQASTSPGMISPDTYPKRTLFWERKSGSNGVSTRIRYQFRSEYNQLDKLHIYSSLEHKKETLPHIAFTSAITELVNCHTNGISGIVEKMRVLYDYVTKNFRYAYVRNYSTIPCVADYCAVRRAGDCGSLAMLLVSMYRYLGVEVRVVGGTQIQHISNGTYITYSHDWLEVRTVEKDWLPIDPFMGLVANQVHNEKARRFYFGNIDPYRMITCTDGTYHFEPKEPSSCLDPFDNQVGEVFVADKCLRYNEIERTFRVNSLKIL